MKKYLFIVLLVGFWGCEDDKNSLSDTEKLVGVYDWISTFHTTFSNPISTLMVYSDDENYRMIILGDDGTYNSQGDNSFYLSGTWSVTEDKFSLLPDGSGGTTIITDYTYTSSTKILTFETNIPSTETSDSISMVETYEKR